MSAWWNKNTKSAKYLLLPMMAEVNGSAVENVDLAMTCQLPCKVKFLAALAHSGIVLNYLP